MGRKERERSEEKTMTAKETIAKIEKEREELRGYFGKEMDARVAAQAETREVKRQLEVVEAQRKETERQLAEVHAHVEIACTRLGVNAKETPADSWTLVKATDAAHKREEAALQRAHTSASILDEIARVVHRVDGVAVLDAVKSFTTALMLDRDQWQERAESYDKTADLACAKLQEANMIGIRATAERDAARKENARLHREIETEHEHVKLLTAENDRLSASLDDALDQLIERGHELAKLRGAVVAQGLGARLAQFVGRIASALGVA